MKLGALMSGVGLLLGAVLPLPAASPKVRVEIAPPAVSRRTFDLSHPPPAMPKLRPPEVGTCVFKFDCGMETQASGSRLRRAQVIDVVIRANLTITIWTPIGGPARVVAHEEAHRQICEVYYRPARDIAERIGWQAIAAPMDGDTQRELERELDVLQKRSIAEFLRETATRCEYAQERFDEITNHSMNPVPEATALAQAVLQERTHYVSIRANDGSGRTARAAPTRPSQVHAAE